MSASALALLPALLGASSHQPAFLWSSRAKAFGGLAPSAENLSERPAADLEASVHALAGLQPAGAGRALFEAETRRAGVPELQVVFLADGLRTDAVRQHGASLPHLGKLLKETPSSLSVPFIAPPTTPLFKGAPRVAADGAEAYLSEHANLLTNGVADILVVELGPTVGAGAEALLRAHDEAVGRISKLVHERTAGNYAALLTGAESVQRRRLQAAAPAAGALHTGPTLLAAQLISLLLLVIFMSGFCCLFSLQTPKKFEEVKQA